MKFTYLKSFLSCSPYWLIDSPHISHNHDVIMTNENIEAYDIWLKSENTHMGKMAKATTYGSNQSFTKYK